MHWTRLFHTFKKTAAIDLLQMNVVKRKEITHIAFQVL